jgi:hypothetical protein
MRYLGISNYKSPEHKLNNNSVGKFKNKNVTKLRKHQHINLQQQSLIIKKKETKLLNRYISALKTHLRIKIKHNKVANIIENKKLDDTNKSLADIYAQCMETKDNLEINKLLDNFLQAIDTEYSENNLPTKPQQKILYNAYLNMSAHYLAVKTKVNSNNSIKNALNIKHNIKDFCKLIDCSIETNRYLKNNMHDSAYISAQMQQLVGKSCITQEKNNFIYEKCLSIYNKPEPQQSLAKAQRKRLNLLEKDEFLGKEDQLKKADENIKNIESQLQHIEQKKLSTQKVFIQAVFNKRTEVINKKLDEMITLYINTVPQSERNIDSITSNIMHIIKGGMKKIKDNHLAKDIIIDRVTDILNRNADASIC